VREQIEHVREGRHGARSAKQAIAIGFAKARRAGVDLKPPKKGESSKGTRAKAERDYAAGHGARKAPSRKRAQAVETASKREPRAAASKTALARQAKAAARKRTAAERSASARKAAQTRRRAKSARDRVSG
jgi:hypothetical protein